MRSVSFYEAAGLTPYRAVLLHLILIGYPFRYGLLHLNREESQFPFGVNVTSIIPPPCSIFQGEYKQNCESNDAIVDDLRVRFFSQFSLACVTLLLLWRHQTSSSPNAMAFVRILLIMSSSHLALTIWLQHYFFPTPLAHAFHEPWFQSTVVCYSAAVALATWSLLASSNRDVPRNEDSPLKWSIPANAIFCDAVFHMFLATASFQSMLTPKDGEPPDLCFCLTGIQIALQSFLLFRSRYFLTETLQLQEICLYRAIMIAWLPLPAVLGSSFFVHATFRVGGFFTYCLGFSWAGKAEGFSTILTSEKED